MTAHTDFFHHQNKTGKKILNIEKFDLMRWKKSLCVRAHDEQAFLLFIKKITKTSFCLFILIIMRIDWSLFFNNYNLLCFLIFNDYDLVSYL